MRHVNARCRHSFNSTLAPCPDNIEGCCVGHFDANSHICPECGYNAAPDFIEISRTGRFVVTEGIGMFNPKGLRKLDREEDFSRPVTPPTTVGTESVLDVAIRVTPITPVSRPFGDKLKP